uniref:Ig-like domain-containing protein n=1 Tax=Gopherus evgoodei TaxID=1825980 RepID=A0A8C4YK53_9SAUR
MYARLRMRLEVVPLLQLSQSEKVDPSYLLTPGESAHLQCKIKGSLEIQVTWFKNNKEIRESNTYRMSFVNSVAVLDISDVKVEDSGSYSCEAVNDAGSDSCSTEIVVKGLFLQSLPASFLVKPENQQAVPNSMVEFKTVLKGTPPFAIKWFKEDLELVSGANCFIGIEGSTGFLTLYSVDVSKSGHYTCQVSNDVGSDSCTATLLVTGVHIYFGDYICEAHNPAGRASCSTKVIVKG